MYGLFFLACWFTSGLSYLGKGSEAATSLVRDHYLSDYLLVNGRLLLLSLLLGFLLGIYAQLVLAGCRLHRRHAQLRGAALVVLLSMVMLAATFVAGPQLFIEPYLAGGFLARCLDIVYAFGHPGLPHLLLAFSLLPALAGLWKFTGKGVFCAVLV
ncbi:MAG: hypothetical protein D6722_21175, partial [Bacteroidetes bacterium]